MSQIKQIIKNAVYRVASWEPLLSVHRNIKLRNGIVVLMYHELADDDHDIEAWTVVKKSDFVKQMEYVQRSFNVISLGDAVQYMTEYRALPKPTAVITFDDGYAGNKRILLPIIKSMNIPVTIFVSTRAVQDQIVYWYDRLIHTLQDKRIVNIDLRQVSLNTYCINRYKGVRNWAEIQRLLIDLKTLDPALREITVKNLENEHNSLGVDSYRLEPLTMDEVKTLSSCSLITIGAHSNCHNLLTQLPEDELRISIETSKSLLESWTGRTIRFFSYPNGNYNDAVIAGVRKAGLECGLTTSHRIWHPGESFYTIPRIGIGRYDSIQRFKLGLSGFLS